MYQLYTVKALGTQYHKIGITDNIERRLGELQNGNPNELHIEKIVEFQDRDTALKAERFVHSTLKMAGMHVRGEWFVLPGDNDIDGLSSSQRADVESAILNGNSNGQIILDIFDHKNKTNDRKGKKYARMINSVRTKMGLPIPYSPARK